MVDEDDSGQLDDTLVRAAFAGVVDAVSAELRAAAEDPSASHPLHRGRMMGRAGTAHLWSFECGASLTLQPETTGSLALADGQTVSATVVATGDFDLVLAIHDDIGDTMQSAAFVAKPLFVLEALRDRLANGAEQLLHADMVAELLDLAPLDVEDFMPPVAERHPSDSEPMERADDEDEVPDWGLSAEQLAAAEKATRDGLRFVWGPPGTGKTSTLAAAVRAMAEVGRRVMVVAHSNAAVDVAMVRIAEMLGDHHLLDEGRVLRVGVPHLPEACNTPAILPDEVLARLSPQFGVRRRDLEVERRRLSGAMRKTQTAPAPALAQQLHDVRSALLELEREMAIGQRQLIADAAVIGCTLSKFVVDQAMWDWPRDAVVLDEASMAGLPFVFALALESPRTLACFGDFRQLPPIAVAEDVNAQHWLGRDVFEAAGVVERIERDEYDPRLAILRTQYRMGEVIGGAVSNVAYYSLLSTHIDAKIRADRLALSSPVPGAEAVIVDTSGMRAMCLYDVALHSSSHFNPAAAGVSGLLAQLLGDSGLSVGVISPYRAQAQLLNALLRSSTGVTAATMHRFQGSERDAVIVDLVDAAPMTGASYLTGKNENLALRLLNVGISRARGKLLLVADVDFVRHSFPPGSPATRFIDELTSLGAEVVPAMSLVNGQASPSVAWHASWWEAVIEAVAAQRPERIELSLPSGFASPGLVDVMAALHEQVTNVVLRAPLSTARQVEDLEIEVHLQPWNAPAIAILPASAIVSGAVANEPSVLFKGEEVAVVLRRLVAGEESPWRS